MERGHYVTQQEMDQISDWMIDIENLKKLSLQDVAKLQLYFLEYMEKIAPIIKAAMVKDEKATFLFKL